MSDKTASESFISPYLERPLRTIEEVLRGLPKERRVHLMNIIKGSGEGPTSEASDEKRTHINADATLQRRRA